MKRAVNPEGVGVSDTPTKPVRSLSLVTTNPLVAERFTLAELVQMCGLKLIAGKVT